MVQTRSQTRVQLGVDAEKLQQLLVDWKILPVDSDCVWEWIVEENRNPYRRECRGQPKPVLLTFVSPTVKGRLRDAYAWVCLHDWEFECPTCRYRPWDKDVHSDEWVLRRTARCISWARHHHPAVVGYYKKAIPSLNEWGYPVKREPEDDVVADVVEQRVIGVPAVVKIEPV